MPKWIIVINCFAVKRNQRGDDKLYVSPSNKGYKFVKGLYDNKTKLDTDVPILIDGVQGTILVADECIKPGK